MIRSTMRQFARDLAKILLGVAIAASVLVMVAFFWPHPSDAKALRAMLAALPASRYNPAGQYVGPVDTAVLRPPRLQLSSDGVPLVYYKGIGYQANPVTASQYGLHAYDLWLQHHQATQLVVVERVADWLVHRQTSDGRWLYHFDFTFVGGHMTAPWSSALAQGQAMSLLERAYRVTGRRVYLRAAITALRPLDARPGSTPFVQCYETCGHPFFEEYPTNPRSDVLNGFMFTLIGLYDLASAAPRSQAGALYKAGVGTLRLALPRYDNDGVALYCLSSSKLATQNYQAIHVYLLRALNSLHPDPVLRFYAQRWLQGIGRAPLY